MIPVLVCNQHGHNAKYQRLSKVYVEHLANVNSLLNNTEVFFFFKKRQKFQKSSDGSKNSLHTYLHKNSLPPTITIMRVKKQEIK